MALFGLFLAFLIFLATLYLYKWHVLRQLARQHGADLPVIYRHTDPVLGLDWLVGQARAFTTNTRLDVLTAAFEHHGSTFATVRFGGIHSIHTGSPENIRAVWTDRSGDWGVAPTRLTQMEPFCGRGFVNADGIDWEETRALMRTSLRKGDRLDQQPFEESIDELFTLLPGDGSTVDMHELIHKMFLDTATKFLFGETSGALASLGSGQSVAEMDAFLSTFSAGVRGCGLRMLLGPLRVAISLTDFPRACTDVARFVNGYVDRALALRASLASEDTASDTAAAVHPLGRTLLYHVATGTADRQRMHSTITQALMATLDTTSNLLSNTIWLLARHPEAYAAVRQEALAAGPKADLGALPVLRNTLHESLRLHPVFPIMNRVALRDTTLPSGGGSKGDAPVFVPQGTVLNAHWHIMHRTPAAWGGSEQSEKSGKSDKTAALNQDLPGLDVFDPPRWHGLTPAGMPYMPFGAAQKRCLGQDKALREAGRVLVRLATTYARLEPRDEDPQAPYRARVLLSASNANGCLVGWILSDEEKKKGML